jgi:hypothetical protein
MQLTDLSQIVYNFAASAAVVIGGTWAYFKFARGRTFYHRAEASVVLDLEERDGNVLLCATVALKNAGLSKLPIARGLRYVQVYGMVGENFSSPDTAKWERLLTAEVFDQHGWVEAQETITDSIIFRLQDLHTTGVCHYAYKVEAWLGTPRRRLTGKGNLWHARAVVVSPTTSSSSKKIATSNGKSLIDRVIQWKGRDS